MKKVFIIALISVASSAFSQVGKVGINTPSPAATLDIQPNTANALTTATTAEGLLVPRVSRLRAANMGVTPAVSTLIYVNSVADGSATGTTANVDAVGFYYFNGSVWTKLNAGGGGGTDTSIYAGDGTLTSARTVNQNNQNLTFTTGTGQMIVNGTTNQNGAIIKKVTGFTTSTYTLGINDNFIIYTPLSGASTVTLGTTSPDGRKVCVFNNSNDSNIEFNTQPRGAYPSIFPNSGTCLISYGGIWYGVSSY